MAVAAALAQDEVAAFALDADRIAGLLPGREVDVYMCGPRAFQKAQARHLIAAGVAPANIRYELFGVTDEAILGAA